MTNRQRIVAFLQLRSGSPFCDPCVLRGVRIRALSQVDAIVRALGMARKYYLRPRATRCAGCGEVRSCILYMG